MNYLYLLPLLICSIAFGQLNPNAKLDLVFDGPENTLQVGNVVSLQLKVQPQTEPQRFLAADIAFTWNPSHVRLIGIDLTNNAFGVWDQWTGFPEGNNTGSNVCCDLFGTNEVIPPQDGTGLVFVYGQLGYYFLISSPELLATLNFEVVGQFQSTQVATVPALQAPNGLQQTVVYGSNSVLRVTGNHYPATLLGSVRVGDFNNDNVTDSLDMAIMLSSWGQVSFGNNPCDLNNNGVVDAPDLAILFNNWG